MKWLFMALIICAFSVSHGGEFKDDFKFQFSHPVCGPYKYPIKVYSNDGVEILDKPLNVYCLKKDSKNEENREIADDFYAAFGDEDKIVSVRAYVFIFNDVDLAGKFCDLARRKIPVEIFTNRVSGDDERIASNGKALSLLEKCSGDTPGYLTIGQLGRTLAIPSQHSKLYMVEYLDGRVNLIAGSGHTGRGQTINFDHWIFYSGDKNSNFWKSHVCFANAIKAIASKGVSLASADGDFRLCRQNSASNNQSYKEYFFPFDRSKFWTDFLGLLNQSNSLDIAMFAVGSQSMRDDMLDFLSRGLSIRLIVDDDIYWKSRGGCSYCTGNATDLHDWIYPLIEGGAEVRFMQTNHNCTSGNLMHHKMAIFNGEAPAVLLGGANWTGYALGEPNSTRRFGNVENSYIFNDSTTYHIALSEFDRMWGSATVQESLPTQDIGAPTVTGCF